MNTSHLYCILCGAKNQAQAAFCDACGAQMQTATPPGVASSSIIPLSVHHLLKQRYQILDLVGQGGFGAVYKAQDIQFGNRLVAVKEMRQGGLSPQEITDAADAFKQEAFLLASLKHPYLPSIYDYFTEAGRWYLVMDFIEGETLEAYLSKSSGGSLPVEEVLTICTQLSIVLNYLHTRQPSIIFRDLKPANIMRTPDGDLYLIDFGIARHFKPGQAKDTIAYGSAGYSAPEQYGKAQTTPRSDIYSLGALLHQMLSGHDPTTNTPNPFLFPSLSLQGQFIPTDLTTLIERMLAMDEKKRPTSMLEVKQELQRIANDLRHPPIPSPVVALRNVSAPNPAVPPIGIQAHPGVLSSRNIPWKQRKSRKPILVGGLTLALIAFSFFSLPAIYSYNNQVHKDELSTSIAGIPHATQTAFAQANATAIAANPLPSYFSRNGTLVFDDPLHEPYYWSNYSDGAFGGSCQFTDGAYHVNQSKPVFFFDCPTSVTFSNFAFEVRMTVIQGDCGGVLFRADTTNYKYYYFSVCQDKTYKLLKYEDNSGADAIILPTPSLDNSAINAGLNQVNLIAVTADGNTLNLYINSQQIASVQDSDYTSGSVALVANSISGPTEVMYSDAKAWTI